MRNLVKSVPLRRVCAWICFSLFITDCFAAGVLWVFFNDHEKTVEMYL